jgi:hypothetical protein
MHLAVLLLSIFVAGAATGYFYRSVIASEVSKLDVSTMIRRLELAAEGEPAKLKTEVTTLLEVLRSKISK